MRIVHLTHTDIRYDNRILKELECLATVKDYEISAIGINQDEGAAMNDTASISNKLRILDLKAKKIKFLPRVLRHLLVFIELFFKTIFQLKHIKPEVIHCHDTLVLPIGLVYKITGKDIKLIYDAHELESDKNGQNKIMSYGTLLIEKISWSKIDFLITVSPSIGKWYESKFSKKPTEIILNAPKISELNFVPELSSNSGSKYFHEIYSLHHDTKIFIYLGALVPGRYIEQLLRIFSCSNRRSVIVFIGYGELKELIFEHSQKCVNIKLHPAVPHDKVVETIKSADIGLCLIENVSLSDYYSLPNKLFEYTFAKKRILASNFPDIKNLVEKYDLGKCCDLDYDSIKQAIESLELDESSEIKTDLYELSWENQHQKLLNIYHTLIR